MSGDRRPGRRPPPRASVAGRCRPGTPPAAGQAGPRGSRRATTSPRSGCWRAPIVVGRARPRRMTRGRRLSPAAAPRIRGGPARARAADPRACPEAGAERVVVGRPPATIRARTAPAATNPRRLRAGQVGPGLGQPTLEWAGARRRRRVEDETAAAPIAPSLARATATGGGGAGMAGTKRTRAYIGLGANVGDAAGRSRRAVHALAALPGRPARAPSRGSTPRIRSASPTSRSSATRRWPSTSRAAPTRRSGPRPAGRPEGARARVRPAVARALGTARDRPRPARLRSGSPGDRAAGGWSLARCGRPGEADRLLVVPHPEAPRAALRARPAGRPGAGPRAAGLGGSGRRPRAATARIDGADGRPADRPLGPAGSGEWRPGGSLEPDRRRPAPVEHVDRVDEPDLLRLVGHHERVGPGATAEEADALEQVAARHPGRGEDEVVARREVLGRGRPGPRRRRCPSASARARSSSLRNRKRAWISPPRQRSAAAVITPSGAPPMPITAWTPVPGHGAADRGRQVAVGDQLDPGAGRPHLLDQVVVARPLEDRRP